MTEHIAHHEHVAVFVFYADSVHAQELGQERAAMTLHYVLGKKAKEVLKGWLGHTVSAGTGIQVLPPQSQAKTSNRGHAVQKPPDFCLQLSFNFKLPFPFHLFISLFAV